MKRVLLLGGTGAMGKHLAIILAEQEGWQVDVTSRYERVSDKTNLRFLQGNAKVDSFLYPLLDNGYDAVVDFMNYYDLEEFKLRVRKIMSSTKQYIWFSSCRVYADSEKPLTEESPRLLEKSDDKSFLATNRYALRKARQEDIIKALGYTNYTIVRPYITYSEERLQLGVYEKEQWLYRILRGRDLVINEDIVFKTTTMTYGYDVSMAVSKLIGNSKAYERIVQIVSGETMTWYH